MLPENKATGLIQVNSKVNKPKLVVHLGYSIASTPTTKPIDALMSERQDASLQGEMALRHNFRSLNTPENTVIDMSRFYTDNEIKHNNIVLNHNYNSINYLNTSDEALKVKEHEETTTATTRSHENNSSLRKTHYNEDKQSVLQTKSLNFPVKIRPEYEIYQMDEKLFKRQLKIQKTHVRKNATPTGLSR